MVPVNSSVLLRWQPEFKELSEQNTQTFFVQDYSASVFMVEQLVAAGASHIVSDNETLTSKPVLDATPEILKKRIAIVRPEEAWKLRSAFLAPILDELEIEDFGVGVRHSAKGDEHLAEAAVSVWMGLEDFLLACREELTLDYPLDDVRKHLSTLLLGLRSREARARVATLAGVFESYRAVTTDAIQPRISYSDATSREFVALLEDDLYQQISAAGRLIGIPSKLDHAVVLLGRSARRLAESAAFKPIVNLFSKVIAASTHLPVPDSEIGALITKRGFMPPIVSMKHLREKARNQYRSVDPPFLPHPSWWERH